MNINNINNIDDEWQQFMTSSNNSSFENNFKLNNNYKYDSDSEYNSDSDSEINTKKKNNIEEKYNVKLPDIPPEPTNIYISTKSKIAYLNNSIDLKIFWEIPIISYYIPKNGIIKKQMKFNSKSKEELDYILDKVKNIDYYEETIMSHIDNPNSRIKFKDIRKISIGMSKKDIMTYRSKKKQAFYNCFVLILRLNIDNTFKEFHIKVFNTGQLEIPGIQNDEIFEKVLDYIINLLQPFHNYKLSYKECSNTVLINSNFNCGFYINREVLYDLLKYKYGLQSIYDPCSYPGIQSKFYFNKDLSIQDGKQITSENKEKYKNITEVSFMIFRTGSVLIVGKCDVDILTEVYNFLVNIFKIEFKSICQRIIYPNDNINKQKNKKIRKKTIYNSLDSTNINLTTLIQKKIYENTDILKEIEDIKQKCLPISSKKGYKFKKNQDFEFEIEN